MSTIHDITDIEPNILELLYWKPANFWSLTAYSFELITKIPYSQFGFENFLN